MTKRKPAPVAGAGSNTTREINTAIVAEAADIPQLPLGGTSRREAALAGAGALSATAYTSWLHRLARTHISLDVCRGLAKRGFPEIARELMRQRGDIE